MAEGESSFREFVSAFQSMVSLAPTSSKIEAHLRAYTNKYLDLLVEMDAKIDPQQANKSRKN